jgi:hypothetical protein
VQTQQGITGGGASLIDHLASVGSEEGGGWRVGEGVRGGSEKRPLARAAGV